MPVPRIVKALGFVPLAGAVAVLLTMRLYWGYWIAPPPVSRLSDLLASVDRFTTFHDAHSFSSERETRDGEAAISLGARKAIGGPGSDPMPRLCHALRGRGLAPTAADPVADSLQLEARRLAKDAGYLGRADPAFPYPFGPIAHVAEGVDRNGDWLAVVALSSGEQSNDHYGYCEAALRRGP